MEEEVRKRLREGWIKSWMMIEVLAVAEGAARSSLEKHIESLEKEKRCLVYKKSFHEIKKVQNPLPKVPEGYSYVCELELLAYNFNQLFLIVLNYAPSAIEILSPENIKMDMGEAQGILNSLADILHRFAAMGIGGVIIKS